MEANELFLRDLCTAGELWIREMHRRFAPLGKYETDVQMRSLTSGPFVALWAGLKGDRVHEYWADLFVTREGKIGLEITYPSLNATCRTVRDLPTLAAFLPAFRELLDGALAPVAAP